MVAAGSGTLGSGDNVVPGQVAMEKDAKQQVTADAYHVRKRLTGTQKRKQR